MKYLEMTLDKYISNYASKIDSAPGGGAASALLGAQGAGLATLVTDLTTGRKKYEQEEVLCAQIREKSVALASRLVGQIDADSDSYRIIKNALQMPKETEEERQARRKAIADGTLVATQVPFETMELAFNGLMLCQQLVGHSNTNAVSDLGVAALSLHASIKSAWLNILINLNGIWSEDARNHFEVRGRKMFEEAEKASTEIFEAMVHSIEKRLIVA